MSDPIVQRPVLCHQLRQLRFELHDPIGHAHNTGLPQIARFVVDTRAPRVSHLTGYCNPWSPGAAGTDGPG
ncbi:MAG: hypothetical protein ACREKB_19330, partial [Candidatus Rokuibacteriota bacterium]